MLSLDSTIYGFNPAGGMKLIDIFSWVDIMRNTRIESLNECSERIELSLIQDHEMTPLWSERKVSSALTSSSRSRFNTRRKPSRVCQKGNSFCRNNKSEVRSMHHTLLGKPVTTRRRDSFPISRSLFFPRDR